MKYDNFSSEDWRNLALNCQSLRDSLRVFEDVLKHRPEIPEREMRAEESVAEIRQRSTEGESVASLALSYGVSKGTISILLAHKPAISNAV